MQFTRPAVRAMATPAGDGGNVLSLFSTQQPPAVSLSAVTVRRGRRTVLRDVSIAIPPGAITAVVGPSGAGKSTLLGVLNGLIRPARGTITVAGIGPLEGASALRNHRLRTATIFQEHALIDRLSAFDNVLLGLADRRNPLSLLPWPESMRRQAAAALADVGLLHCAYQRTAKLSGGERQRVGIARALVRQPSLMLADEPFAALDPALQRTLGSALRSAVTERGVTLVIVLHHIEMARALACRIIGLADGRVAFAGAPREFDAKAEARLFQST